MAGAVGPNVNLDFMIGLLAAAVARFPAGATREAGAALLARLASGDMTALSELYDQYSRLLYSLALRVLGDEGDAEDLVQDVFTRAWTHAGTFDVSRGSVTSWLVTMTRTKAIDRLRARRARPEGAAVHDTAVLEDLPTTAGPVEDRLISEQEAARVRDALATLPLLERMALELAYYEGLSQSEIAERLEQPLGTVKTRMRRALLKLRDIVGGAAV
jgi:RNA polymerase sigma-70 factor (ECF subfamily)